MLLVVKKLLAHAGDVMYEMWVGPLVGEIPWRRERQPTPVFFPGEFHGQRSLAEEQSVGLQRVRHD